MQDTQTALSHNMQQTIFPRLCIKILIPKNAPLHMSLLRQEAPATLQAAPPAQLRATAGRARLLILNAVKQLALICALKPQNALHLPNALFARAI